MTSLHSSLLRGGGGSRPTSSSSSNTKRSKHEDDTHLPQPYHQELPPWRPPLHPAAPHHDIPDLFPTKPNQPEDDMSQISVRKGFVPRSYVRNETFSAHDMIYTRLASPDTLRSLSSWMDEVMQRRRQLDKLNVAPTQYKPPSRVTLNEAKLANYVKDLADPNVPLTRLSKSVPHGFRGEKLFEMLWAGGALPTAAAGLNTSYFNPRNNTSTPMPAPLSSASTPAASAHAVSRKSVDISRAVWFIRALGAAELSSFRNKSAAAIVPEITSNLCTWMAKQVAELNLVQAAESSSNAAASPAPDSPSTHLPRTPVAASTSLPRSVAAAHFARIPSNLNPAPSPSTAPTKQVCTVLQNELDEERWTAKWSYSLSLARHLHAQHLLDRSILVRWIVDAFAASNLVQLPFLLELIQEVLVFILRRRCFVRPFLTALLIQIPTLDARLDPTAGGGIRSKLMLLLRIVSESCPDALVSPRLWYEHATTLNQLFNEFNTDAEADPSNSSALHLSQYVEQTVKPRVDRLLLRPQTRAIGKDIKTSPAQSTVSQDLQQHLDIQALDSFDMKTLDRVFLQSTCSRRAKMDRDDALWAPRIETILTWACTDRRSSVVRQYLAATLIEKIRFGVSWEESSEETDQVSLPAFDLEHHTKKTRKINVEPMLIKWLGDVEASLHQSDSGEHVVGGPRKPLLATIQVGSVVVLIGELARRGVFSYTKYLQRLIARGMTASSSCVNNQDEVDASASAPSASASASRDSLHLRLLRSLPLYDQPASVYQQRRQAIYGDRTKETYEDAAQRRALRQLQACLPFAFVDDGEVTQQHPSGATYPKAETRNLDGQLSRLWSASRFVRCKIFRDHLVPAVTARIDSLDGDQLSQISEVLVMADDFEGLAQLLATLLLRPLPDDLARAAFNLVIEFSLVWRSMDIMGTLNQLVRQQLNHSSSVRNDRQAVMASTTLLRLRTLIEGIPIRIHAPALDLAAEHDAIQQHVQALRPDVDVLLERFAQRMHSVTPKSDTSAATPAEGSDILTPFRGLFLQPDATSDEIIERTIVQSVMERSDAVLIPAAVRLVDQLYLEASLEIDERHARWLAHLATGMEQNTHGEASVKAFLGLVSRLVAHGTLNLQLAMDTFLLPHLVASVRRMTDPATRSTEAAASFHLNAVVSCLSGMFASSLGEAGNVSSYEDMRAFGAQTMLLFGQANLPCLLKAAICLICASDEASPIQAAEKTRIEAFWKTLLRSEPMQIAFRQDPRLCMLTIRDTCKSMWGCTPSRVMDLAMACLDPTSLLLGDVSSIDATSVKARLDGWDTGVVASELVDIFERLQLVESSFQSRADSKTRALASAIFDDLFVRLPDLGAQLIRDCQSSGLISRFTDIGVKILSDKIVARAEASKNVEQLNAVEQVPADVDGAQDSSENAGAKVGAQSSEALQSTSMNIADDEMGSPDPEVDSTLRSVLRMCEQQDGFVFNATDGDSCGRLLLHIIACLETTVSCSADRVAVRTCALLHSSPTFQLLHLVLRFGCLWNGSMKATAHRLIKALLALTRQAGERSDSANQFLLLLDSLGFVLDELPPPLLSACVPEMETQLHQVELATPEKTEKLEQLSYTLDNAMKTTTTTSESGCFVASSAGAALKRGWFTPGGLNPWECAEYLDVPPTTTPGGGGGGGASSRGGLGKVGQVQSRSYANLAGGALRPTTQGGDHSSKTRCLPGARTGWTTKLYLNTAIPVSMLGLRVTRDLVPNYTLPVSSSIACNNNNNYININDDASNITGAISTVSSTNATGLASPNAMRSGLALVQKQQVEGQEAEKEEGEKDEDEDEDGMGCLPMFVESERSYGDGSAVMASCAPGSKTHWNPMNSMAGTSGDGGSGSSTIQKGMVKQADISIASNHGRKRRFSKRE
uniref:Mediator of RNA polymerase II transcription subunit 12 n=1 Tax=Melanopsichium pennsylvanicum 4 TaxID=1398559 RepID=A0A077QT05_9BASI|nr:conserved hypothetical protein [Melanopsichium pennsylvanicum 4]